MIEQGSRVTLHFVLITADGRVVESTYERGQPVEITIGDGHFPESFETCLLGLESGVKEQWELSPEQAFGQSSEGRISTFTRAQFPSDSPVEEGMVMGFSQPNGDELPGIIKTVDDDVITVDFNHPLSGETIIFAVEIVACYAPERRS
ncbi:FKBP-type peptidyl-prolyl cis-trans isomerase [Celerinatantimonas yamalensis]|uniref:Peptidyl-prolyl cis-trans isomerase n=1 Tax=Celerinatantimonas yamalensis TaxID=559956 RepID=A0ABW9GAR7_9GAMM